MGASPVSRVYVKCGSSVVCQMINADTAPACVYPKPASSQRWQHLSAFLIGCCSNEGSLLILQLIFPSKEDTI